MNGDRTASDERGLNSIQMLGLLAGGMAAAPDTSDPDHVLFANAWADLSSQSNDYVGNLLNNKITAPSDDNYSDDELTMFAYWGLLFNTTFIPAAELAAAQASLARTWAILRTERPGIWDAMAVALGQPIDDAVYDDVLWNLRTVSMALQ